MTRFDRKHFLLGCSGLLYAQQFPDVPPDKEKPRRLPDGTLQSDAILKDEQKRMLADAARLTELSTEVETELKKNGQFILSLQLLKKLEEVEKIARRMRSRHNR